MIVTCICNDHLVLTISIIKLLKFAFFCLDEVVEATVDVLFDY